jgi:transposase-like protein
VHDKIRCPSCGGADVRHSLPRGLLDSLMMAFGKAPFRCRGCERRFHRHVAAPAAAEAGARTETAGTEPEAQAETAGTAQAETEESVRDQQP